MRPCSDAPPLNHNIKRRRLLVIVSLAVIAVVGYIVHYVHVADEVGNALRPCATAMGTPFHPSTETIPCYEKALRIDPGNNWLRMQLADEFTTAGKFNEARPLYQKVSSVAGLYRAEARWDLLPGHMQKKMKIDAASNHVSKELQALTAWDAAEEAEFLRQHAQVINGEITSMSGPYKEQWLQMRAKHSSDQQKLQSILNNRKGLAS